MKLYKKLFAALLCCLTSLPLFAQQERVTGLITDGSGNPIPGVIVTIAKNANTVAVSDENGRYSIAARSGDVLVFNNIAYTTQEVVVRNEPIVNVRLEEAAQSLEDVVVIGYGQQKKESVVSAINTVTSKELSVTGRGLSNSLAGQLAGLIAIQPSGEPGYDDSNFWIRGVSSFAGGTNPLIVIDGVPRSKSDMSNIPVEDLETFTVLKDAAATAVYGAEGANGVVIVTTKRGSVQKTSMTVNVQHSIRTPLRLPRSLDAYHSLNLYNEALWNEAGNPLTGWIPKYDLETLEKYRNGTDPDLYPNVDWLDLTRKHTNVGRYTINFRGGGDRMRFFVSGAYYTEDGLYHSQTKEKYNANLKYERFSLRSNIDMDLSKTTKLSVDLSGYFVRRNAPMTAADDLWSIISMAPTHLFPMIYSDGTNAEHPTYSAGSVGSSERANPFNLLNNFGYTKAWEVNFQSKVNLVQDLKFITEGFSWRAAISFDGATSGRLNRTKEAQSFFARGRDAEGNLVFDQIRAGSALSNPTAAGTTGSRNIYFETAFDYKRTFGRHDVTGLVLFYQKERQASNDLPFRKQSVVARATYGFDSRYLLEVSMGATGSENFAKGFRWGAFPAVGAAWWLSNEKFWDPIAKVVNKMKFRVSYGLTGNDEVYIDGVVRRFPYRPSLNDGAAGYNFSWSGGAGQPNNGQGSASPGAGVVEGNPASPLLQWEVERKFNTGFDFGFFNGRIDGSVDYFVNKREKILVLRGTIPSAAGLQTVPIQNFGRTEIRGVDLNLVVQQRIDQVMLSGRFNYTYSKSKITEQDEVPKSYAYQAITGRQIGQPSMYIAEGLFTPDDFYITVNPNGSQSYTLKEDYANPGYAVLPGDIKYRDLNNDGLIDSYDTTYDNGFYPTNAPGIVYGFGLSASWKGLSLGVFFQGANRVSTNLRGKAENFFPFQRSLDEASLRPEAMNRWRHEDPYNQDVLFPRLRSTGNSNNTRSSTWWYRDASYLRLKNVELSYMFDSEKLQKVRIRNIRVYVQGENLHTWDKVKFWDPEQTARSGARYPISSTWTLGLDVTF